MCCGFDNNTNDKSNKYEKQKIRHCPAQKKVTCNASATNSMQRGQCVQQKAQNEHIPLCETSLPRLGHLGNCLALIETTYEVVDAATMDEGYKVMAVRTIVDTP